MNRILLRRSGILKTFFRLESTERLLWSGPWSGGRIVRGRRCGDRRRTHRLANWLPLTAGRPALLSPLNGSGTSVTVPPAAVIAASAAFDTAWAWTSSLGRELAAGEHLDEAALAGEAVGGQRLRGRPPSSRAAASSARVSRLIAWYSTRNGLLNPFSFGHPLLERHLAALEAAGTGVAGVLALRAAAGGLAALAADAASRHACGFLVEPGAGERSWTRIVVSSLRSSFVSTRTQVRDPGEHAPDLGAVGQGVGLADAAEAEGAQRAAASSAWRERRT